MARAKRSKILTWATKTLIKNILERLLSPKNKMMKMLTKFGLFMI